MKNKKYEEYACLLPFLLCMTIIPLIVKIHNYPNPLLDYPWYSSSEYRMDMFLYYKSLAIIGCGIIIIGLGCLCYKHHRLTKKEWAVFTPLFCYAILAILSSVLSEYKWFSFHGMPDQNESLWVILSYVLLCVYSFWYVYQSNENQLKHVVGLLLIGVTIVGIICTLQFFHIDIYRMIYANQDLAFNFQPGQVYGPFYNINYVGSYVTLVLPILIMLVLSHVNGKYRIVSLVGIILLLFALIGGDSSAGIIATISSIILGLLFFAYRRLHNWKKNLALTAAIIIVVVIAWSKSIQPKFDAVIKAANTEKHDLERIITNDDNVEFHYKGHILYLQINIADGVLVALAEDEHHQTIPCSIIQEGERGYYQVDDKRFEGCTIEPILLTEESTQYGVLVHLGESDWCISNQIDDAGSYYYITSSRKATKLTGDELSADIPALEKLSSLANGRGYLWNKSLVTSKKYILLGSGADTFAFVYPNDDYVDKSNNGYYGLIVTRPHNMYLQIAVQTGWFSLICFLVLCGWYLINSLQIYYSKKFDSLETYLGFGVMLGVFGYLVTGIANDSTVTVAPVFWMLLGIGIAINHNLKRKCNE